MAADGGSHDGCTLRKLPSTSTGRGQSRAEQSRAEEMSTPTCPERPPALLRYSRKRHRPSLGKPSPLPDWAALQQDLVQLIGWRVLAGDLHDYVRLRAVCKHWSSSTVSPGGRGVRDPRFHPRRWMMLPEGHGLYPGHPGLRGCVRFFNLSTGAFARAHLPLLHDHVILDSVDGLLLLHRDHDTAVRLLHPFTGDITDLPPLDSLMPQVQPHHICYGLKDKGSILRSVCAVVAVSATGTINVVLALYHLHRVAYAAAGDTRWVLSTWKLRSLMKPVAFQGKFYAMHGLYGPKYTIRINVIDPLRRHAGGSHSPSGPSPEKFVEWPRDKIAYYPVHLVECDSELLVVAYTDDSCAHLQVYRLADLMSSKMVPMASIGDHALFLGDRCLCLSPSTSKGLPSIIRNSIICMHTCIRTIRDVGRDENCRLEQYHLDSGIWTPASDGNCVHKPPSNPCTLIHHIFTCCHREYWNKGIIFCTQTEPVWLVKPNLRIGS